jgi:methylglyoxal synthase
MIKSVRKMSSSKRIALVAHDNKKHELIEWAIYNKEALSRHRLYGTGTTGSLVEAALGQTVTKFLSGPLGGDQQIGSRIAEGKIDVLIFFWDPMEAQPHDPDIKALLRLAVAWNIPFACDRATADFLLTSPLMYTDYEIRIPDYSQYIKRLQNPAPIPVTTPQPAVPAANEANKTI